MRVLSWSLCALWLVMTGCADDGSGDGTASSSSNSSASSASSSSSSSSAALEPTYSSIQAQVFSVSCAVSGCHTGANPPQGLNLESDQSYGLLVDVAANEVGSLDRVEPGDPNNSYLIHKLEGSAAVGARMPADGPPYLTESQIEVIRQWISDGALDDRTMAVAAAVTGAAPRVVAVNPSPGAVLDKAPAWASIAVNRPLDASLITNRSVRIIAVVDDSRKPAFGTDTVDPVSVRLSSDNPALIKIDLRDAAMSDGRYRIVVSSDQGIEPTDIDGVPIDGDADGKPGGAYTSEFTINSSR